jgi:hypothetical protein
VSTLEEMLEAIGRMTDVLELQVDHILAEGDVVVVLCTDSAQRGDRSWSSPPVHVWTVRDAYAANFRSTKALNRPKMSSSRRRPKSKWVVHTGLGRKFRKVATPKEGSEGIKTSKFDLNYKSVSPLHRSLPYLS